MFEVLFAKQNIVHLGAALYLVGLLFRDQILLRAFLIGGDLLYISYFYFAPHTPLWGGIFWSAAFTLVNAVMIARILADRTDFGMTGEERQLFSLLDPLSPGEFRRLIKAGRWRTATAATVLTEENHPLDRLHYVLDGNILVDMAGRAPATIAPRTFIGEVAFLLTRSASATVTVAAGARYITWERAALRRLQIRAPSLAIALSAALNKDMAAKVARAEPRPASANPATPA